MPVFVCRFSRRDQGKAFAYGRVVLIVFPDNNNILKRLPRGGFENKINIRFFVRLQNRFFQNTVFIKP